MLAFLGRSDLMIALIRSLLVLVAFITSHRFDSALILDTSLMLVVLKIVFALSCIANSISVKT